MTKSIENRSHRFYEAYNQTAANIVGIREQRINLTAWLLPCHQGAPCLLMALGRLLRP